MSVAEKMTALADAIREKSGVTGKLTIDGMTSAVKAISSLIVASASGNPIVLNDSTDLRVQSLRLFGKTTQSGTPTPEAPVPLVSAGDGGSLGVTVAGKNLIPSAVSTQTVNGVTFTVNPGGSITVNGTATDNTDFPILGKNWNDRSQILQLDATKTYIASKNTENARLYFRDVVNNWSHIGRYNESTTLESRPSLSYVYIFVEAGKTVNSETIYPMLFPADEVQTLNISTPNGLPGIPVTSGGNYTDETGQQWVCDEVDFARGVYVQRVFEIDLASTLHNGNLVTHSAPHPYAGISRFVYRNETELKPATSMLCNQLPFSRWGAEGEYLVPHGTAPQINIQIKTERLETDDIEGLTAYARKNPFKILMELNAPIETPLSAEELAAYAALHTNYPNTTILNDGGAGMEVSYVADTKNYIDNQIAAVAAAIVNA